MANNIRFGSTSDPRKFAPVNLCMADEYGDYPLLPHFKKSCAFSEGKVCQSDFCFCSFKDTRANCNPNNLLQCPFDKNHQIRSCRFPYHIIKCRKVSCNSAAGKIQFGAWIMHTQVPSIPLYMDQRWFSNVVLLSANCQIIGLK